MQEALAVSFLYNLPVLGYTRDKRTTITSGCDVVGLGDVEAAGAGDVGDADAEVPPVVALDDASVSPAGAFDLPVGV